MVYAETRFAPHLFINPQTSVSTIIDSAVKGLLEGKKRTGLHVNLILCVMRGADASTAHEVVELVEHDDLIVGIDMAGDESKYPGTEYINAFLQAQKRDIPITIHAGEAAGPDSVRRAIDLFGASRIGHGLRSIEDPALVEDLKSRDIMLEICLTSNLQTGTVKNLEEHPFPRFLKDGVKVSINTDDPSVSGITLGDEYSLAREHYSLSDEEMKMIILDTIQSAFCNDAHKKILAKKLAG